MHNYVSWWIVCYVFDEGFHFQPCTTTPPVTVLIVHRFMGDVEEGGIEWKVSRRSEWAESDHAYLRLVVIWPYNGRLWQSTTTLGAWSLVATCHSFLFIVHCRRHRALLTKCDLYNLLHNHSLKASPEMTSLNTPWSISDMKTVLWRSFDIL